MASSNMKDIKRRIKSVESTRQITKAMELVASSKLRKAKEKADNSKPFFKTLYETMCEIVSSDNTFNSIYTRKRKNNVTLLVVIGGDREALMRMFLSLQRRDTTSLKIRERWYFSQSEEKLSSTLKSVV